MGTGMAFPWSVIGAIRFATGEIVEDLECGVELARAGHLPLFCPEARVTSFFPVTAAGVAAQRKRWEHGHLGLILRMALPLLVDGIRRRNLNLVAMSLDMSVPPLALLFLASVTVFLLCALLYGVHNLVLPLWMASAALVLLSLSTLLAWTRYGRHIVGIRELAFAPVYALMKIPLYLAFIVRRQVEWVRSARDGD
jgi:cellulose synthase/poly-beta-1,6-N-acetylglucosamine synthase-like glycosyltransferase